MLGNPLKIAASLQRLGLLPIVGWLVLGALAPSASVAAPTARDASQPAAMPAAGAGVEAQRMQRPRIGLVLGGGGARALAHIGVLEVLEEQRVPVDFIAGSSIGALVGGLYASGMPTGGIKKVFRSLDWSATTGGDLSLLLHALVRRSDVVADLDQLPIPFSSVATDLETGEHVWLREGPLSRAMRASFSIPGVVQPLRVRGRLLADGGLVNNLPAAVARKMGADRLVVVDVGMPLVRRDDLSTLIGLNRQIVGLLSERNAFQELASLRLGDLLIRPEMADIDMSDFGQLELHIEWGRKAARKAVIELQALALSTDEYRAHRAAQAARAARRERTLRSPEPQSTVGPLGFGGDAATRRPAPHAPPSNINSQVVRSNQHMERRMTRATLVRNCVTAD